MRSSSSSRSKWVKSKSCCGNTWPVGVLDAIHQILAALFVEWGICSKSWQSDCELDQQNIGLMFSDQFARIIETVSMAVNMIPLVARDDCSHPLLADARVPNHDPAQRKECASRRAFFHGYAAFNKLVQSNAILNSRF